VQLTRVDFPGAVSQLKWLDSDLSLQSPGFSPTPFICGGQSGTGFSPGTSFIPCQSSFRQCFISSVTSSEVYNMYDQPADSHKLGPRLGLHLCRGTRLDSDFPNHLPETSVNGKSNSNSSVCVRLHSNLFIRLENMGNNVEFVIF